MIKTVPHLAEKACSEKARCPRDCDGSADQQFSGLYQSRDYRCARAFGLGPNDWTSGGPGRSVHRFTPSTGTPSPHCGDTECS